MDPKINEVKKIVDELLAENRGNLCDGSDLYAQGYHDALLDLLARLKLPVNPEDGGISTE